MLPNFYPVLLCNTAVPLRPRIADTSSLLSKMRNVKKSVLMLTKCFFIKDIKGVRGLQVKREVLVQIDSFIICLISLYRDFLWNFGTVHFHRKAWGPIWWDLLEILKLYTNLLLQQSFGIPVKSLMCQGHK